MTLCFSDVLQVGFPLPDFLDMDYNLAELDLVEVRKGAKERSQSVSLANE